MSFPSQVAVCSLVLKTVVATKVTLPSVGEREGNRSSFADSG